MLDVEVTMSDDYLTQFEARLEKMEQLAERIKAKLDVVRSKRLQIEEALAQLKSHLTKISKN
jgi:hypothetical protein